MKRNGEEKGEGRGFEGFGFVMTRLDLCGWSILRYYASWSSSHRHSASAVTRYSDRRKWLGMEINFM